MDIFTQRAFNADRFTQPFVVYIPVINALTALPHYAAKLAKTLKQQRQIAALNVFAGA